MSEYYNKEIDTIFQQAVEYHHQGELSEAEKLYRTVLETLPQAPIVLYNLGLLLFQTGNLQESEHYYRRALEIVPDDGDILYNLALCIKSQGRLAEACNVYNTVLAKYPDDIESRYNLGCCQKDMQNDCGAIETFKDVIKRKPDYQSAINNLAYLYHKNGQLKNALEQYSRLLAIDPSLVSAKHMINALKGNTTSFAPQEYVAEIFDEFAKHYDTRLVEELEYTVPESLFSSFSSYFQPRNDYTCLDIGCGTGLGGMAFKPICKKLVGVDLSTEMVARASARNIYDTLHTKDIVGFLKSNSDGFSLIIATDVFTYIGELEEVFLNISNHCLKGCYFCFSDEETSYFPFKLQESGRFAHSSKYIEDLSKATGWNVVDKQRENLRKERGEWIIGSLFLLQH